jgi:hypothetical protein
MAAQLIKKSPFPRTEHVSVTGLYCGPAESSSLPVSVKPILILSSHLHLGLPSDLIFQCILPHLSSTRVFSSRVVTPLRVLSGDSPEGCVWVV